MKRTLLLSLLALGAITAKAQITLEHSFTYKNGTSAVVLFSSNGTKIMVNDTSGNQVKLYNTDYSLWKTITLPSYTGYKFQYAYCVSDNLFNSDNSVELVAVYTTTPYGYKAEVVSESGAVLQSLGSTYYAAVHYINGVYKLVTTTINTSTPTSYTYDYYSLPGTMPCGQCGGLGLTKNGGNDNTDASIIPNPNNGAFIVNGKGDVIVTNAVGETIYQQKNYNNGVINIAAYPAGVYMLRLGDQVVPFVKQ